LTATWKLLAKNSVEFSKKKKKNKERKKENSAESIMANHMEFQESLDKLRSSLMQLCYNNFFSKINATANILSYVLSNDNVHHTRKKRRKQFKSKWEIQSYNDYTRRFGKTSWLRKKRGAKIGIAMTMNTSKS
jgi:hypothetical protein